MVYKPSLYADEIGLTSDKYIPLNASVTELPLRISFAPMSLQVETLLFLSLPSLLPSPSLFSHSHTCSWTSAGS